MCARQTVRMNQAPNGQPEPRRRGEVRKRGEEGTGLRRPPERIKRGRRGSQARLAWGEFLRLPLAVVTAFLALALVTLLLDETKLRFVTSVRDWLTTFLFRDRNASAQLLTPPGEPALRRVLHRPCRVLARGAVDGRWTQQPGVGSGLLAGPVHRCRGPAAAPDLLNDQPDASRDCHRCGARPRAPRPRAAAPANPRTARERDVRPDPPAVCVYSDQIGFVEDLDVERIRSAASAHPATEVELTISIGDAVSYGDLVARVWANDLDVAETVARASHEPCACCRSVRSTASTRPTGCSSSSSSPGQRSRPQSKIRSPVSRFSPACGTSSRDGR